MNLKTLTLAAALAVASMTAATAAPDPSLKLTPSNTQGILLTEIDSAKSFWEAFEAVFVQDLYDGVAASFASVVDLAQYDPQVIFVGGSWNGILTFNGDLKRVDFSDQTGLYTRFISDSTVAVPGPEAGAGIGALAMAGIAYVAMRRRKQQLAA